MKAIGQGDVEKWKSSRAPGYDSGRRAAAQAYDDLRYSLQLWDLWTSNGLAAYKISFRRAFLGVLWEPLSYAFFVFVIGYLYSRLLHREFGTFIPYLAAGMMHWRFIQGVLMSSCRIFENKRAVILNTRMPFSYFLLAEIFEKALTLLFSFPIFIVILFAMHTPINANILYYAPALVLYAVGAYALSLLLSLLTVRFRDLGFIITSVLPAFFLITPIIWHANDAGTGRSAFVKYNPFYHAIEIARAPLLGIAPAPINWLVTAGVTVVLLALAWALFIRMRRRITYWI